MNTIFWDVDNTLLNFNKAEEAAMAQTFATYSLPPLRSEQLLCYSLLNDRWWKKLERGEVTKSQLLTERFREFFSQEGIDCTDYAGFNTAYQLALGDHVFVMDNGVELVRSLRGRFRQYAVSNGTKTAQRRKLRNAGLDKLFDDIFISEEVGAEKPSSLFFERVLTAVGSPRPSEVIMVGDSLTSDMKGGREAGLICCWYNPQEKSKPEGLHLDFEIRNLWELIPLLNSPKPPESDPHRG